jgi:hypothetical protein
MQPDRRRILPTERLPLLYVDNLRLEELLCHRRTRAVER